MSDRDRWVYEVKDVAWNALLKEVDSMCSMAGRRGFELVSVVPVEVYQRTGDAANVLVLRHYFKKRVLSLSDGKTP